MNDLDGYLLAYRVTSTSSKAENCVEQWIFGSFLYLLVLQVYPDSDQSFNLVLIPKQPWLVYFMILGFLVTSDFIFYHCVDITSADSTWITLFFLKAASKLLQFLQFGNLLIFLRINLSFIKDLTEMKSHTSRCLIPLDFPVYVIFSFISQFILCIHSEVLHSLSKLISSLQTIFLYYFNLNES